MKIIVLNDGKTFSAMHDCIVHEVPDTFDAEDIKKYLEEDGKKYRTARFTAE